MTSIAVLDYGIGNLRSAQKALEYVGADAVLVTDANQARNADAVVLPGVGAFGACMQALRSSGLDQAVFDAIDSGKPFLGICVGMQMLYAGSAESREVEGLGVFDGMVQKINGDVKLPQMQWNKLAITGEPELLANLDEPWMYFVHSYAAESMSHVVATCEYGANLPAVVHRDNVWATQFHPEKSSSNGLELLRNFLRMAKS